MSESAFFWLAGASITGFLFLAAWCWVMRDEISKRTTFKDLETRIVRIEEPLNEIHFALLGDMETEGLISRERRRAERCIMHKVINKHNVELSDKD